ncbi:MAG: protein kinase, partial [Verrucomicrobiae bacterium]|nr:protein kinase [Verrucomicrobiae bacterium]
MTDPDDPRKCPRCGARMAAAAPDSLCPACLLSGALEPPPHGTRTIPVEPGEIGAPPPPEPRRFPCNLGGYRLLDQLGSGGMGTVFEAEERATGRRVALKMLGRQLDSPEMRQRFLREGRLAARVNHPNSLYVFGSEEIEGRPVITMEIAAGGTLQDRVKAHGPLPVAEAVDAILDVIAGLESAAAEGVLHRDIKPSNCFIGPDGRVKVGDYGLSVSTLTRTDTFVTAHGKIMGTPAYASPEQLRGDTLDVRADIYSVGATLYTLLTDRAPFEGDNAVQVVANAVNQPPRPLNEPGKEIPPALAQVVMRCLAKEPDGRFADYRSLRHTLLPFSSAEPQPAPLKVRAAAGWMDYLIAFLVPYVVLTLAVGAERFHFQPFFERTLASARYYFAFLAFGFLYFAITEGIWGAGLGKRLKGLRVIRRNGRPPGVGRALLRVVLPLASIEVLRVPFLLATIAPSASGEITSTQAWVYTIASNVFPWVAVLLT